MPGLDPGIHPSSQETVFEEDGLPGHPRSSRGQAPGNDDLSVFAQPHAEIAFAESTWLRSMNFWIFPVDVFGIGPNTTAFGVLKPDMWLRQKAMISASVAFAPSFSSTKAQGTSPHFGSGLATTAANSTAGGL